MGLKSILEALPSSVYLPLHTRYRQIRRVVDHVRWEFQGMPNPPSQLYKILTLRNLAKEYRLGVFVETGTLFGETTEAVSCTVDRCITIELDQGLFELAVSRFAGNPKIELIQGDSAAVLPKVLEKLREPALFWLDGHYSGDGTGKGNLDTPIRRELDAILAVRDQPHIIAIDDARSFDGTNDYPTLDELNTIVHNARPVHRIEIGHDIIRIVPARKES
jgi:hypothetical protein